MDTPANFRSQLYSFILAAIFAVITFALSISQTLLPLEQLLYDRLLRIQFDSANPDVVIVAMDEKSLQRYGPLPWSRQLHTQLINQLSKTQVKAIGYDVLFNKRKNSDDDALVEAVKNNGKIVFPVVIERVTQTGELIELMPFPELTQATNNLGLVHFELSSDNIARSSYLMAGLGEPYWRSFAVEVLDVANGEQKYELPIKGTGKQPSYDLTQIEQERLIYLPFKQNLHHFKRISFVDLVESDELLTQLTGKVVFVGVTATAARNADFLPVPVDRDGQIMPGVEINATLYEALDKSTHIQEISPIWNASILALFAFIFFNFLPHSLPRRSFYYGIIFSGLMLLLAWWLLHNQQSWFKVATLIVSLLLGYLIWIWRKMVANMNFFKSTVERLAVEMKYSMKLNNPADLKTKLKFLSHIELVENAAIEKFEFSPEWNEKELQNQLLSLQKEQSTKKEKKLFRKLIQLNKNSLIKKEATTYGVIEGRIKDLEEAIRQLNFLRRFVEQTMDRMSDAIVLSDTDGQIFYSNLVAQRYIPQLKSDSFTHLSQLLELMTLKDNQQWSHHLRSVLQDGVSSDLIAITNNGLDLKLSISLLDNVSGRDFIILNMTDVSAIKREQRRQLEMIDFISHDLRSPMTSILALLSRYKRAPENYDSAEMHTEIEKLTRSSLTLAEQFLMLSRTESNIDVATYPVELLSSIDNAMAIVMPQAASANITLEFDFMAYEDIWLNANQDLLERVIINLLSNAVKYSPEDSSVWISIEQTDSAVKLKVKDQGEGIKQEQMEAIFKPFTRMQKHEMAKVKGIGLGLRFVRAAMLRFGGKVAVESSIGEGSCFTLEFPNSILVQDETLGSV